MDEISSFTHLALKLASQGKPIPMTDATSHLLPGLIWSGHLENVSHGTGEPYLRATLSAKGRTFLQWLEE